MRQKEVMYFTEKEEEFVQLLIEIGMKPNVAKVLVFLTDTRKSPSRAIERGTGLRQPEVSVAVHYLLEQGWIRSCKSNAESKGRPLRIYTLAQPISGIIDSIAEEKGKETLRQLQIITTLRNYVQ